ncbi:MAG: hypothetical protein ACKVZJ_05370 [Phycisphaerales bacterium]
MTFVKHGDGMSKLLIAFVLTTLVARQSGAQSEMNHLDFERLPDSTVPSEGFLVSNQYAAQDGVSFSCFPSTPTLPRVAVEGGNSIAFSSSAGQDNPMTFGARGLCTVVEGGRRLGIAGDFSRPVDRLKLFLVDIDGDEQATVRALGSTGLLAQVVINAGSAGTGDGVSTPVSISAVGMTRFEIEVTSVSVPGTVAGFAIDSISLFRQAFVRPRPVVVSQETSPSSSDFSSSILGVVFPWSARSVQVAEFYFYRNSFTGSAIVPQSDRSHLLLADLFEGLTLVQAHDRQSSGSGGQAETRLEILGDADGARRTIEDEPQPLTTDPDVYFGAAGTNLFTERHGWASFDGDGQAISGLSGAWSVLLGFSEVDGQPLTFPIQGLSTWAAYSSDSGVVDLALQQNRRVLLRALPDCESVAYPSRIRACFGQSVRLSVIHGSDSPRVHQWYREGVLIDSTINPSAASPVLVLSRVGTATSGTYMCIAVSSCGAVQSNSISLVVSCRGDFDSNGIVDTADLTFFVGRFGSVPQGYSSQECADLNGDGLVTTSDLATFLGRFGDRCP